MSKSIYNLLDSVSRLICESNSETIKQFYFECMGQEFQSSTNDLKQKFRVYVSKGGGFRRCSYQELARGISSVSVE